MLGDFSCDAATEVVPNRTSRRLTAFGAEPVERGHNPFQATNCYLKGVSHVLEIGSRSNTCLDCGFRRSTLASGFRRSASCPRSRRPRARLRHSFETFRALRTNQLSQK